MKLSTLMRWAGPAAIGGGVFMVFSGLSGLPIHIPYLSHDTPTGYDAVGTGLVLFALVLLLVGMVGLYAGRPGPRAGRVIEYGDARGRYVLIEEEGLAVEPVEKTEERSSSMVGYMSLEEQVDADFSRARRKALLRRIGARLQRDTAPDGLLCFDDLRKIPGAIGRIDRGMRTVPVSHIGGSVGRCSEFDRDFMPAKASVEERWKRIDRAFHRGEELPPVSLYKIGSFYFVLDGHHRVSVAAYHGVGWIDAEVREFGTAGGVWSERRDRESA